MLLDRINTKKAGPSRLELVGRILPILFFSLLLVSAAAAAEAAKSPKLVICIVVDQFRYDYLMRYKAEYKSGLALLMDRGAVFTNAFYQHFPTVTAVGHSVVMSGAMPSVSGIVGNDWYDRNTGKRVTSVGDDSVKLLGGNGAGSSPNRLLVSTVGDELKAATSGKARVIGISMKERAAVLLAGHAADAAYWYDSGSGHFVSSTFYFQDLPDWVKDFNNSNPFERYRGAAWAGGELPSDAKIFPAIISSPFGNELVESFAERAIKEEKLGKDDVTDLLAVSFTSNDYVGHNSGPESPQVKALCKTTDEVLGRLFKYVDASVGLNNVLVVLTADHGVAPTAEANAGRRTPGGGIKTQIQSAVQNALSGKYGEGRWILSTSEHTLYLNLDLIREKKLERAEVEQELREMLLRVDHVFRVYTRSQLMNGSMLDDSISRRVANGFHQVRGGDVYLLLDPFWFFGAPGTTHGSAFNYDTHVPIIFMGPWIRPGIFDDTVAPNDIASTLSTILEIETPNGSEGRALKEIILRPGK